MAERDSIRPNPRRGWRGGDLVYHYDLPYSTSLASGLRVKSTRPIIIRGRFLVPEKLL